MKDDFLSMMELNGCGSRRSKSRKTTRKSSGISGMRGKTNYNKSHVVAYAAKECGVSQNTAKCVLDKALEFIKVMCDKDSCVTIAKFGSFRTRSGKYDLNGKRGTYTKLTFKASK
ncbi:MAG: hypothetical protein J6Z01_15135 [Bacteroidales bacterium]|nr:hypothetical protein [Bacteroidales bacterium]